MKRVRLANQCWTVLWPGPTWPFLRQHSHRDLGDARHPWSWRVSACGSSPAARPRAVVTSPAAEDLQQVAIEKRGLPEHGQRLGAVLILDSLGIFTVGCPRQRSQLLGGPVRLCLEHGEATKDRVVLAGVADGAGIVDVQDVPTTAPGEAGTWTEGSAAG